jgi:high-affinity iron transporter
MRRHASAVRGEIERRLEEARENRRLWVVGLIAFTGVFREGAETVLFLWGLLAEASVSGTAGIAGGALGIAVAAVLGWLIFHGGRHISLRTFFGFTSALLLLVAAGLFSAGLGKLQAFGWLPGGDPLWDTSSILSDQGAIGGMLGGIVGYRARPSAIEVAGWLLYLVGAGWLIFRGAGATQESAAPATSPTR